MSRCVRVYPLAWLTLVAYFSMGTRRSANSKLQIGNTGILHVSTATEYTYNESALVVNVSNASRPASGNVPEIATIEIPDPNDPNKDFGIPAIAQIARASCAPISVYNLAQFCPDENLKNVDRKTIFDNIGGDYTGSTGLTDEQILDLLESLNLVAKIVDKDFIKPSNLRDYGPQHMFLWAVSDGPPHESSSGHIVAVTRLKMENGYGEWVVYDPWVSVLQSLRDDDQVLYGQKFMGPKGIMETDPSNFVKWGIEPLALGDYIRDPERHGLKGKLENIATIIHVDCPALAGATFYKNTNFDEVVLKRWLGLVRLS